MTITRRVPAGFGIDANDPCDLDAFQLAGGRSMGRYLSDDGFPRNLTPEEVEAASGRHFDFWLIWQNEHSEELWRGRSGREIARKADRMATARGFTAAPIFISVDKWTSRRGEWPIDPVLRRFEEAALEIGVHRIYTYGTVFTIAQLAGRGLISGAMQTDLFHLAQGLAPPPRHPISCIVQYANVDKIGGPRYGVPAGDGHYVALDRLVMHDHGQVRPA